MGNPERTHAATCVKREKKKNIYFSVHDDLMMSNLKKIYCTRKCSFAISDANQHQCKLDNVQSNENSMRHNKNTKSGATNCINNKQGCFF